MVEHLVDEGVGFVLEDQGRVLEGVLRKLLGVVHLDEVNTNIGCSGVQFVIYVIRVCSIVYA